MNNKPVHAFAGIVIRLSTAVIGVVGAGHAGIAAPLNLPSTPYSYVIVDQDLSTALQEFGTNLGIKVNVSPEVRGRLEGKLPELAPLDFLNRLASMFNLDWYYDGQVLYVTTVREMQSRLLVLAPITYDPFKSVLASLGVSDDRYTVRPAPGNGLVLVSGPPRFVALVEQTLAALVAEEQARPKPVAAVPPPPRETVLGIYRGSHATILRDGKVDQVNGPDPRIEATGAGRRFDDQSGDASPPARPANGRRNASDDAPRRPRT